jgi:hypothetical protein
METLAMIRQAFGETAWAVQGESKLNEIEKRGERGEKSQEHAHHCSSTSRGLFTNNSSWQDKQSIPHMTVKLYSDWAKIWEDFAANFGNNAPFHISFLTREFFLPKTAWLSSPIHLTLLCFLDWIYNWEPAILTQLRWLRQDRRRCNTPSQNTTSRMHSKMAEAHGRGLLRGL